jgi:ankyrin repeat protein
MHRGGGTVLHDATGNGYVSVVKLLLGNGADVISTDNYGRTALSRAVETGHRGVRRLLLKKEAEIAENRGGGRTMLH